MSTNQDASTLVCLVYDKKTGCVIHIHYCFDIETERYPEVDLREAILLASMDPFAMRNVTDRNPDNLDVLLTRDLPEGERDIGAIRVDVENKIVRKLWN